MTTDFRRFISKVDTSKDCWIWLARKDKDGYGVFWFEGRNVRAHRFSHSVFKESVPSELIVMHSCDNPSCVNPDHLSVGTKSDNLRDCYKKRRASPKWGKHDRRLKVLCRSKRHDITAPGSLNKRGSCKACRKLSRKD